MVDENVPDFGFEDLKVGPKETAWLELPQLRGGIAVEGYFAGHDDSSYLNAKNKTPTIISANPTKDETERAYENERRLFARHVLCGWRNVKDRRTDTDLPFSEQVALAFLRQIPEDVFTFIVRYFTQRQNFVFAREREAAAKALSGNSVAGSSGT